MENFLAGGNQLQVFTVITDWFCILSVSRFCIQVISIQLVDVFILHTFFFVRVQFITQVIFCSIQWIQCMQIVRMSKDISFQYIPGKKGCTCWHICITTKCCFFRQLLNKSLWHYYLYFLFNQYILISNVYLVYKVCILQIETHLNPQRASFCSH